MDNYNFDRIGKRMPYRVQPAFFDDVETKITANARLRHNRHNVLKIACRSVAVAVALALLLIVGKHGTPGHHTDFAEIAQAFDNQSAADQSYLLEIYQDDIFY